MLLRRAIASVRNRDWASVLIEMVVVILGVFIGVQASNWNEARETDRKAAQYTLRLTNDLRAEAWGYEMHVGYFSEVLTNAIRAADALSGRATLSDEALLIAAYRATQYNVNIRRRATYDELTSTGEIGLIRDMALRELAMGVYTASMFDDLVEEGKASQYRHWFRLHVPHEVQQALLDNCSDRVVLLGDYAGIVGDLDYPCSTGLSPEALAAAVAALRSDHEALPLLRLRISDVKTNFYQLTVYFKFLRDGLHALAKEAP